MAFRRILVGTDFSPASKMAFEAAKGLLAPEGKIRLVHSMSLIMGSLGARGIADGSREAFQSMDKQATASAADVLRSWEESASGLDVGHAILHGPAAQTIAAEAERWKADLVVVAGGHRSRLERFFLGSRARAIMHAAPCSVLIVHAQSRAVDRIAVAVDFGEPSQAGAGQASLLAADHGSKVVAFHAIDPEIWWGAHRGSSHVVKNEKGLELRPELADELQGMMKDFVASMLPEATEVVLAAGKPIEVASRLVEDQQIDLVVVGTHGRGRMQRFFLGSVAQAFAERLPTNVLVVRAET